MVSLQSVVFQFLQKVQKKSISVIERRFRVFAFLQFHEIKTIVRAYFPAEFLKGIV